MTTAPIGQPGKFPHTPVDWTGSRRTADMSKDLIDKVAWAIAGVIAERRCDGVPAINDQRRKEARAAIDAMQSERDATHAAYAAGRKEALTAADKLGYHCIGCGHLCGNPEKDLAMIRKAGGLSCCPERKMEPLSAAIRALKPQQEEGSGNDCPVCRLPHPDTNSYCFCKPLAEDTAND